MSRAFHLGDILSITTGYLVSPTKMAGVHEILDYMTGDSLLTHQLGRAAEQCKPELLSQIPALAAESVEAGANAMGMAAKADPANGKSIADAWLAAMVAIHGEWYEIYPIKAGVA